MYNAEGSFARKQLEKHGWTEGVGLGSSQQGIREAIRVKIKQDTAGVGHDPAKEFSDHWWDHVFNKAAASLIVENGEDGVMVKKKKIAQKERSETAKKALYSNFIKSSLLNNGTETRMEKDGGDSDSSEDETRHKVHTLLVTDEELLKKCGGRTAHKGARHGLKFHGKLARIQEQERLVTSEAKNHNSSSSSSPIPLQSADKGAQDLLPESHPMEQPMSSDVPQQRKKSKKRKRGKSQEEEEVEGGAERETITTQVCDIEKSDFHSKESKRKKKKRKKEKVEKESEEEEERKESVVDNTSQEKCSTQGGVSATLAVQEEGTKEKNGNVEKKKEKKKRKQERREYESQVEGNGKTEENEENCATSKTSFPVTDDVRIKHKEENGMQGRKKEKRKRKERTEDEREAESKKKKEESEREENSVTSDRSLSCPIMQEDASCVEKEEMNKNENKETNGNRERRKEKNRKKAK